MPTVQSSFLLACLLAATFSFTSKGNAMPTQPGLVPPESLAQGFIIVVEDKTGIANQNEPIYLASNHVGWNAGHPDMKLTPRSDGRWQIILPQPEDPSPLAFKFTRGAWEVCEISEKMEDTANRALPAVDASKLNPGQKPVLEFVVFHWADERPGAAKRNEVDPYRTLEVTGDVRRLQIIGGAGNARGMIRDALIWLPPGYNEPANADRAYPVLYLQDGQNVFEQLPNVPGEWHADETADQLISEGLIEPIIIVAIPHAGAERSAEYLPFAAMDGVEPLADEYLHFLTNEVMPRVERAFRVKQGPEHTAIGGSSFGGVFTLYAATHRPDLFGMAMAESVSTLEGAGDAWPEYLQNASSWPSRLYLGVGGQETGNDERQRDVNQRYVQWARDIEELAAAVVGDENVRLVIDPRATHTEDAWANRFSEALKFLFPVH